MSDVVKECTYLRVEYTASRVLLHLPVVTDVIDLTPAQVDKLVAMLIDAKTRCLCRQALGRNWESGLINQ